MSILELSKESKNKNIKTMIRKIEDNSDIDQDLLGLIVKDPNEEAVLQSRPPMKVIDLLEYVIKAQAQAQAQAQSAMLMRQSYTPSQNAYGKLDAEAYKIYHNGEEDSEEDSEEDGYKLTAQQHAQLKALYQKPSPI